MLQTCRVDSREREVRQSLRHIIVILYMEDTARVDLRPSCMCRNLLVSTTALRCTVERCAVDYFIARPRVEYSFIQSMMYI